MSLTNANPDEAAKSAKSASRILATLPTAARNNALTAIHSALTQSKEEILAANARDLQLAKKAAEDGKLSLSIVSRLDLSKKGKWEDMLKGILDVRELEDPGESTRHCLQSPLVNNSNSWKSHFKDET
jgi:glutamate-5-semialdehyde dehydrogenase